MKQKESSEQYLQQKMIAEMVKKEVVEYMSQDARGFSYFAIIANNEEGYAVPIENILEIIQVPTKDISEKINYYDEAIPIIKFEQKKDISTYLGYESYCVLCKDNRGAKKAIYLGDIWDSFRLFFKTLPNWHLESTNYELKEQLTEGVFLYQGVPGNGYQLNFVNFEEV